MLNDLSRQLRQLLKQTTPSNIGRRPALRPEAEHNVIRVRTAVTVGRRQCQLTKLGSRLHATSMVRGDSCSIAILDASGLVVAWHDSLPGASKRDCGIVGRHVSQFYLAYDVAFQRPNRRLLAARLHGSDTQEGWYRRPGGSIFWGVTVIEAMRLEGDDLHGYSHVTRYSPQPRERNPERARHAPSRYLPCYGVGAAAAA